MIFGSQLAFAARVLRENTAATAGGWSSKSRREVVTLAMQVVVPLAVLAAAAWILRNPAAPAAQQKAIWAAVGVVIGYWLR
jgi:hypothetical protein